MFHVINLDTGLPVTGIEGTVLVYATGTEAACASRSFVTETGKRHQPRPVVDTSWIEREATRLKDGTYTQVPWEGSCWWYHARKPEAANHFAHVSTKVPGNISFTETDEKGARDIQTSMKPGRYLTRFYNLDEARVRELANSFLAQFGLIKLLFADTADEIERVYTNGPRSCMSHTANYFESSEHPCRVYAAGDLSLAYLTSDPDEPGGDTHITARALCWPAKKIYSRCYGDEQKIEQMLQAQGYTNGSLDGAKMLKIEDNGRYVVPYVDGSYHATERGRFLIIDCDGDINCERTDGLSEPVQTCGHCGDAMDDEESSYIDSREERWCYHCAEQNAFYCEDTSSMIANDDGIELADGSYVSERDFERNGFTCEGTDRRYIGQDDMVVLNDGTIWHRDYFEANGFQCDDCGECFTNDDKHDLEGKDCSENTCLSCAGDAADIEPDTDEDCPTVLKPRVHVARQGRDNLPGQLELNFRGPYLFNARVGDVAVIVNNTIDPDRDAPDGEYEITAINDYLEPHEAENPRSLIFRVLVCGQEVLVYRGNVARVIHTANVKVAA